MERKLIDYLPPVLRGITDFMAVTAAEQPEIEAAWNALQRIIDEQFIESASEAGVGEWETELGIIPHATDTLAARKARIKATWISGVVYTYKWLVEWLRTVCGAEPPVLDEYTLHVKMPITADYAGLLNSMRQYIAANIRINPTLLISPAILQHYTGSAFRIAVKQDLLSDEFDAGNIIFLTDEAGILLVDGAGFVFFEEAI